jgi:hypothetical protein
MRINLHFTQFERELTYELMYQNLYASYRTFAYSQRLLRIDKIQN